MPQPLLCWFLGEIAKIHTALHERSQHFPEVGGVLFCFFFSWRFHTKILRSAHPNSAFLLYEGGFCCRVGSELLVFITQRREKPRLEGVPFLPSGHPPVSCTVLIQHRKRKSWNSRGNSLLTNSGQISQRTEAPGKSKRSQKVNGLQLPPFAPFPLFFHPKFWGSGRPRLSLK